MSGRTPAQAVAAFLDPLQRAVSCITPTPLQVSPGGRQAGGVRALTFAGGQQVWLRSASGWNFQLDLAMRYEVVRTDDVERGPLKVSTRGYTYTVSTADGAEVLAYHWHPADNPITWPHLHMGSATLRPDAVVTRKQHLPTDRVSVESIIRYCISELNVSALRVDWQQTLAASEELFRRWRTWP